MNRKTVAELKTALAAAHTAYAAEYDRLAAAGFNSGARYQALKPLKATVDGCNAAYVKAAHAKIARALDAIIEADRPYREAAARARSPWKQAKWEAAQGAAS